MRPPTQIRVDPYSRSPLNTPNRGALEVVAQYPSRSDGCYRLTLTDHNIDALMAALEPVFAERRKEVRDAEIADLRERRDRLREQAAEADARLYRLTNNHS